MIVVH